MKRAFLFVWFIIVIFSLSIFHLDKCDNVTITVCFLILVLIDKKMNNLIKNEVNVYGMVMSLLLFNLLIDISWCIINHNLGQKEIKLLERFYSFEYYLKRLSFTFTGINIIFKTFAIALSLCI